MDTTRSVVRRLNGKVRLQPDTTVAATGSGPDRRTAGSVGRRARLELTFGYRRGRTSLTHAYVEPPFRVGRSLDAGTHAHIVLVCSGPGIFCGDVFEQRVTLEAGARVVLVSQSALQVHPAAGQASASIDQHYDVAAGAELDCFWDPLIPFAGSRLTQRIALGVAAGARLFWSDALMAGRVGRGESWRFDDIDHELALSIGGTLRYLERYRLTPAVRNPLREWIAGTATYSGTTLVYGDEATAEQAERVQRALDSIDRVRAGADCVADRLVVGRLLAEHGPGFAAARTVFREMFSRQRIRGTRSG